MYPVESIGWARGRGYSSGYWWEDCQQTWPFHFLDRTWLPVRRVPVQRLKWSPHLCNYWCHTDNNIQGGKLLGNNTFMCLIEYMVLRVYIHIRTTQNDFIVVNVYIHLCLFVQWGIWIVVFFSQQSNKMR